MGQSEPAAQPFTTPLPRIGAVFALAAGCLALLGWLIGSALLKGILPGAVAMNPVTAIAFVLSGLALWSFSAGGGQERGAVLRKALALAVALVAALKLASLVGLDVGVDRVLFTSALDTYVPPNRMAPNTALSFLLVGCSLLLVDSGVARARAFAQVLVTGSALIALVAVVGYVYDTGALSGVPSFIPMAINTAIAFLVLDLAILFLRPRDGLMARATSDGPGGALLRVLLPAVIVLPVLVGWLLLEGVRVGLYGPDLVPALLVVATMVVFTPMLWRTAGSLDRAERERTRLRHQAELERATLDAVLESMTDGLLVLDEGRRLRYGNSRATALFATALGATVGQPLDTLPIPAEALLDPDAGARAWERALEHPSDRPNFELSLEGPPRRDILVQVFEVAAASSDRAGIGLVLRDVTAERELAVAKEELISMVSHELRTPLASLVGFTELLLVRDYAEAQRKQYLTVMLQEGRRLTALINDFLDLQRLESGRFEIQLAPTDPVQLLGRAISAAGDDPEHPTVVDAEDELPLVQADADRILQVLVNLLSNARKYSPEGGEVRLLARSANGSVAITVRDQGLGIPPDALPQLFQKFYRVKNSDRSAIKGTGLGLAICRQIVEAHGGRIWAESDGQGAGSSFHFNLPTAGSGAGGGEVLIVEDDSGFARLLDAELVARGITSSHATTAEAALVQIAAHRPRAILLDLRLPGMQGEAFLRRIRESRGEIPVIVVSVKDHSMAEQEALERQRPVAIVQKGPGAAAEAATIVERVLRGAGSGARAPSVGARQE